MSFQEKHLLNDLATMKPFVSLMGCLIACSFRIAGDRQTDQVYTVTLTAHACRGLIIMYFVEIVETALGQNV